MRYWAMVSVLDYHGELVAYEAHSGDSPAEARKLAEDSGGRWLRDTSANEYNVTDGAPIGDSEDTRLRDEFAMAALQGIISEHQDEGSSSWTTGHKVAAEHAYLFADAMLAARSAPKRDGGS
jgi:hypothetical protein